MKIVRYFIKAESEETGDWGFIPLWIPKSSNFSGGGFLTCLHDSLEHTLCDKGTFNDEMLAFGRIVALRLNTGLLNYNSKRSDHERNLGEELAQVFVNTGEIRIDNSGKYYVPSKYAKEKESIKNIALAMVNLLNKFGFSDQEEPIHKEATGYIVGWLSLGFMDAIRRYGGTTGCETLAFNTFGSNNSRSKKRFDLMEQHAEEHDLLRLTIDTNAYGVRYQVIEYPERFAWARKRIHQWRNT